MTDKYKRPPLPDWTADDDRLLRHRLEASRPRASEKLKYRIMHQIETEAALRPRRVAHPTTDAQPAAGGLLVLLGVMYAVIGLIVGGVWLLGGMEALKSAVFLYPALLVAIICSLFSLISTFDDHRRSRSRASTRRH